MLRKISFSSVAITLRSESIGNRSKSSVALLKPAISSTKQAMPHVTSIDHPESDKHATSSISSLRSDDMKQGDHCTMHEATSECPAIRILVVEDDRSSADILCLFFQMEGYDTECVYCGQDALDSVAVRQPTIIFLDLGLPDINGYEVADRIRELAGDGNIQLVALTGRDEDGDRRKISEAGFDQHVVKPPAPAMLRDALEKAMAS